MSLCYYDRGWGRNSTSYRLIFSVLSVTRITKIMYVYRKTVVVMEDEHYIWQMTLHFQSATWKLKKSQRQKKKKKKRLGAYFQQHSTSPGGDNAAQTGLVVQKAFPLSMGARLGHTLL